MTVNIIDFEQKTAREIEENINGNVTDLQSQITEANAALSSQSSILQENIDVITNEITNKLDSSAKASVAQAQAGNDNTKYATPKTVSLYVNQYGLGNVTPETVADFNEAGALGNGIFRTVGTSLSTPLSITQGNLLNMRRSGGDTNEIDGAQLLLGQTSTGEKVAAFRTDYDALASTVPFIEMYHTENFAPVANLSSTSNTLPLAASQGQVIMSLIDNLTTIVSSDDTTLDQIQEIVNFIKLNKATLDTLTISNISGLQNALNVLTNSVNSKLSTSAKATLAEALAGTDDTSYSTSKKVADYVNSYGIGVDNAPNIADLDIVTKSGVYGFSSGAAGRPIFTNGMVLICTPDANNRTTELAISSVGGTYQLAYRNVTFGIGDWTYAHDTSNLAHSQNLSGGTIMSNSTVAGSVLSPPQSGTWRNVSGNDILNNGYGLFKRD